LGAKGLINFTFTRIPIPPQNYATFPPYDHHSSPFG
jgi:hypothetical protein